MNFNREPYYDDFDPENKYYKILFKPGYAVQARELNQIQSSLQHQVNGVAKHLFKKNTMVIPGGVSFNTGADIVEVDANSGLSNFVGKTITNATDFTNGDDSTLDGYITAVVLGSAVIADVGYLYVKYFKSQTVGTARSVFTSADTITTVEDEANRLSLGVVVSNVGKVATINAGVYYTKDLFVDVDSQSIIVEPTTENVTNCIIALSVNESIVTSDEDEQLLDNAQGSPNYAAPGADRYKVELILEKFDANVTLDVEKYITLLVVENDVVTTVNDNTEYAELMKTLAKRTYDANGNFIVSGLNVSVNESSDDDFIWANVSRGSCYLGGYEYNQIANVPISLEKPRAGFTEIAPEIRTFADGLTYFYVAGSTYAKEVPAENSLVQLLNAEPDASSVAVIGYAVFKDIQYVSGSKANNNDIYKVFFDIVDIEKGYSLEDIGGYKVPSANQGSAILHELQLSSLTGAFTKANTIKSTTDSTQTGLIYFVSGSKVYVIKNTITKVPNTDTVKDNTTGATAFLSSTFISNYTDTTLPLIKVDDTVIKTLRTGALNASSVAYSYVKKFTWTVPGTGPATNQFNLTGSNEEFEDKSNTDYYVYNQTDGVFVDYDVFQGFISLSSTTQVTMTIPSGNALLGKTLWVYTTVSASKISEAPKSVSAETTITIATPSKNRNVWMTLQHQDVIEIIKVVDSGASGTSPNINTDVDITSRFILETGNSGNLIGTGIIKLKKGATPPVGQIAVKYKYYDYTNTTGSFVSVDSYGNHTLTDLSYIGTIPDVTDYNNNVIHTRQYLDFRTRTSSYFVKNLGTIATGTKVLVVRNINLSSIASALIGKYAVGNGTENGQIITAVSYNDTTGHTEVTLTSNVTGNKSGIYYIGLNGSSLSLIDDTAGGRSFTFPKDGARLSHTAERFKPKQILVYINRENDNLKTDYLEIANINEATALRRNAFKLPLAYIYMSPYTVDIVDVQVTRFENPVYQMLDIHDLKGRIERNEYYTSLALNLDLNEAIIDANNENLTIAGRGFWNEDFMDPNSQDINSDDFACTIFDKSYAAPEVITKTVNLEFDKTQNTSQWKQTGNAITLPYTEVRAFGNDKASRVNNLNPYNVINWNGKMTLFPSVDNWVDIDSPIIPQPPVEEIVTEINNLRAAWGKDSAGGYHAITFDWKTNLGRTGRVNTDIHLSKALSSLGTKTSASGKIGYDGTYAKSLINKKYNAAGVKEYLNAGTHFDQKPPNKW